MTAVSYTHLQKAAFLFVGKAADKSLKNAVDALVEDLSLIHI